MAYRDGPLQDLKVPLAWTAAVATIVATVVAIVLLLASGRDSSGAGGFSQARGGFAFVERPVSMVLAVPVRWTRDAIDYVEGYFFAISENRRLKHEIRDLETWRDAAIALKNVNERYEALLKLKTKPEIPMVTGRAITDTRGPFANARLLDVGTEGGIKVGDPAMSEHGVVGRIVGVTKGASRMLLLTDVDSRTPVLVDRTNDRAILTGDGSAYPKLDYLRGEDRIKPGDMLLTSGDGGVFPRGLPVGVAVKDLRGVWRVRLYSDRSPIDFVRVLLFQDFSQKYGPDDFPQGAPPALTPAEAADRNAVLQHAADLAKPKPAAPPAAAAPAPVGKDAAKPSDKSAAKPAAATPAPAAKSNPDDGPQR
jgi:rod shape-determining protein MreC